MANFRKLIFNVTSRFFAHMKGCSLFLFSVTQSNAIPPFTLPLRDVLYGWPHFKKKFKNLIITQ